MNEIFGIHDSETISQFNNCLTKSKFGALMADGHLGYIMPIGGVMAYTNQISPVGVGFDIGCGNMAIKLDLKADEIDISKTLDLIEHEISFGIGQTNPKAPKDHPLFSSSLWKSYPNEKIKNELKKLARQQLGTVGSGNHYVDIFADEENYIWIGVHFGSRGLGHKTASGFLNLAMGKDWEAPVHEEYVILDLSGELGTRYFEAMELAGNYAYAGREWVCYHIAQCLGAKIIEEVHNHHNFAWREKHFGEDYIVIRKGATPIFPGQRSFVGGSMGDNAVIIEGVESEQSKKTLYSTVHGAGRIMSRREAAGKFKIKNGKKIKITDGKVSKDMMQKWLKNFGVELRGGGTDESPHVYRRLPDVLKYHEATFKIIHNLKPLGVVMAGENEFDPYKD